MLSLRAHAFVSGGLLALLIGVAVLGNLLQAQGVTLGPSAMGPAILLYFALFLAFGFSLPPLMVLLFLRGQHRIGNGDKPLVRALEAGKHKVVWAIWAVFALGLILAASAILSDGLLRLPG